MKWMWLSLVLIFCSCASTPDKVYRVLTLAGFTDVKVGGLTYFSCGNEDSSGRSFKAKNVLGKEVEGVVCCGWTKACAIMFP